MGDEILITPPSKFKTCSQWTRQKFACVCISVSYEGVTMFQIHSAPIISCGQLQGDFRGPLRDLRR